ncbi:MAG: type II/IV secretion system protein [Opitutaceae bacterium]|nr:type II/IV secretion system protein [Opitutaceae bacterium]
MIAAEDHVVRLALARGLIAPARVEAAARGGPGSVGALLTAPGFDRAALAAAVAEVHGMPMAVIGPDPLPDAVRALLPRSFVRQHGVLPLTDDGREIQLAVSSPDDADACDAAGFLTGRLVRPVLVSADDLRQAIAREGGESSDIRESPAAAALGAPPGAPRADADAPAVRFVDDLLAAAVRRRASDIHLEPLERRLRVRFRVDGSLTEDASPPADLAPAVISRLKLLADISIAERRVPQDGRIRRTLLGQCLDLRVSSLPTTHGESIVMRLLDRETLAVGLDQLGLEPEDVRKLERLVGLPDGIVLVSGPTGSGKTTTLYSCLQGLNRPDRKIITVEDPVEYQLSGVNQVPVRADIGMTYAAALRAMLRQSPNTVMVGEIRDRETAEIAVNAALTGHQLFSTLHTNDAPSAVTRLVELGVRPVLVSAALRATLAQRLVRQVCRDCGRPSRATERELHALGPDAEVLRGAELSRGAGCEACQGTGYRGRMGIFEIFLVDDEIRRMIYDNVTATRLRQRARHGGMRTMREDGLCKVLAGRTTIEEIVSATVAGQSPAHRFNPTIA